MREQQDRRVIDHRSGIYMRNKYISPLLGSLLFCISCFSRKPISLLRHNPLVSTYQKATLSQRSLGNVVFILRQPCAHLMIGGASLRKRRSWRQLTHPSHWGNNININRHRVEFVGPDRRCAGGFASTSCPHGTLRASLRAGIRVPVLEVGRLWPKRL